MRSNMMKLTMFFLAICLSCMPSISISSPGSYPYFFEQLKNPAYKNSFELLFADQKNVEPWVKRYITTSNGVDSPGESRQIQGKKYELYQICEPHNCGGNFLYIIVEPGGAKAWALLTKDSEISRIFGSPPEDIKSELEAIARAASQ